MEAVQYGYATIRTVVMYFCYISVVCVGTKADGVLVWELRALCVSLSIVAYGIDLGIQQKAHSRIT